MNSRSHADQWTLKAKKLGYPARSVFKLEEIQQRWQPLMRPVLDIGAAPGSWSLYALRSLGKGSSVSAVDLKDMCIDWPAGSSFHFMKADVFSPEAASFLEQRGPFGCILSDAAPATSGNRLVDTRKSFDLVMGVIDLVEQHLIAGGNLVVKVFQGGDEMEIRSRLKSLFKEVRIAKPKAVRNQSMEIYLIGLSMDLGMNATENRGKGQ